MKPPHRRCVGCGEMKPKAGLLRAVRRGGHVAADGTGKAEGRGAYICRDEACLAKAQKRKGLERSLKCPVSPEVYAALRGCLT